MRDAIKETLHHLLKGFYPVGSIYLSVNNVNPGTLFGGTWEQIEDRFLLAAGTTYSAGATGGSADAIIPYHNHTHAHTHPMAASSRQLWAAASGTGSTEPGGSISGTGKYYAAANASGYSWVRDTQAASTNATSYAGTSGNTVGANMPPYLAVYVWKRVA